MKRIEDKTVVATADVVVKNGEMGGCWTMYDTNFEVDVMNKMHHGR